MKPTPQVSCWDARGTRNKERSGPLTSATSDNVHMVFTRFIWCHIHKIRVVFDRIKVVSHKIHMVS